MFVQTVVQTHRYCKDLRLSGERQRMEAIGVPGGGGGGGGGAMPPPPPLVIKVYIHAHPSLAELAESGQHPPPTS